MANDDLIKTLLDPVLQERLIEKETEELRRLMKETCSEILAEAERLGSLHVERVAHEAVAGISARAAQSLVGSGFITRENIPEKGGRFMLAACRGVNFGTKLGFKRRGLKP
jgi:hypothetical protein